MSGRSPVDLTHLAALEEERDFLLASLDDLEAERAAGDIDDHDYEALRDDYTARAADVLRAIGRQQSIVDDGQERRSPGRTLAVVAAVLVFAVGAGWLLARAAGERGASGQITGSIDESLRAKVLRCQRFGGEQLLEAVMCFDEVLVEDPQNVEALTYKGWYLVLGAGSAQAGGDDASFVELVALGEASLQQAVDVDPGYPDARAFRAVVFERSGRPDEACQELAALAELERSPLIDELTSPLAARLECSPDDGLTEDRG